jgi:hypothetical protein
LIKPVDNLSLSLAERSRIYRRDVFSYDLWVQHRSTDRFIGNLLDGLKSGITRHLFKDVFLVASIASFICLYNALCVIGFTDWDGVKHLPLVASRFLPILKMPMDFFTLSTPALALLLGTFHSTELSGNMQRNNIPFYSSEDISLKGQQEQQEPLDNLRSNQNLGRQFSPLQFS